MAGSDPNLETSVPGSTTEVHPHSGIPLPEHGFAALDEVPEAEPSAVPAVDVIRRAAVTLMSSAAEKLGLSPEGEPDIDLVEARVLITALAGLLVASEDQLGDQRQPLRDGLRTLQTAFREASAYPDAPGEGPGEKFLT